MQYAVMRRRGLIEMHSGTFILETDQPCITRVLLARRRGRRCEVIFYATLTALDEHVGSVLMCEEHSDLHIVSTT